MKDIILVKRFVLREKQLRHTGSLTSDGLLLKRPFASRQLVVEVDISRSVLSYEITGRERKEKKEVWLDLTI